MLPPLTYELLSSWICRHAVFYGVQPVTMLRHCLSDASSMREIDFRRTTKQAACIAHVFRTDATVVRQMSFANLCPDSHRWIAAKPMQFCANCRHQANSKGPEPVSRSQLLGWRITCSQCGSPLSDNEGNAVASPINSNWNEALNGQRLIDDEAQHGVQSWAPPMELARLLLMRRDPRTSNAAPNGNPRLLGAVLPEIDAVLANSRIVLPSPAKPILPLMLRPALLAAVAILERQGPFMLARLEERMIDQNRSRFRELAATMLCIPPEPVELSYLQHI
ncbi:hypothetical protein F7D14_21470 (plasmid) [Methylocystis parvus]|uniref:TniQ domain-containing protein n=1 Tax=Methylocystis parvus TaxID=134 RepID=A0A6B8ME32_9HYPH|nr:hypothetical protein F7D14_20380 [Methylocystis parvus]QGN00200.1 hypothetical protein F7D14_21470 [Methylocystis parvus]